MNKCINILSNVFNYSALKIISVNPCCRVKRAKVVLSTKAAWTNEQCLYFLKLPDVRFSRFYGMFVLSLMHVPVKYVVLQSQILRKPENLHCIEDWITQKSNDVNHFRKPKKRGPEITTLKPA